MEKWKKRDYKKEKKKEYNMTGILDKPVSKEKPKYDMTGILDTPSPSAETSSKQKYDMTGILDSPSSPTDSSFGKRLSTFIKDLDVFRPQIEGTQIEAVNKELKKFKPIIGDLDSLDTTEAIKVIREYEKNNKDSGWEVRKALDMNGEWSDIVIRKTYLKTPTQTASQEMKNEEKVRKELDRLRYEELAADTNVFEQIAEGLTKPTEKFIDDAIEIGGGPKGVFEKASKEIIPYEYLSSGQKAAHTVSTIIGYVGPGAVVNVGIKGIAKVALSAKATKKLVMGTYRSIQTIINSQVAKNPTMARQIIGQYASKFIKNGPSLAAEGAAWNYIDSQGDPGAAIEGAILFPIAGAGLSVGGEAIAKGIKKVFPKKGFLKYSKKSKIFERQETARTENIEQLTKKEADGFVKQLRYSEGIDDFLFDPEKFAASEFQRKIKAAYTASLFKAQKIELQAKLQRRTEGLAKESEGKLKIYDKMQKQLDKTYLSLENAKPGAYEFTSTMPKSLRDLKSNYATKAKIEAQFGTLDNLKAEAGVKENTPNLFYFYKLNNTLREHGFTQSQARSISDQLIFPEKIAKKMTATEKVKVQHFNSKITILESKLKTLKKVITRIEDKVQNTKRHPSYKELNTEELKKMPLLERQRQLFMDSLKAQGLQDPLVLQAQIKKNIGFTIKEKSLLNQTEFWNRIEEVTGIPLTKVVMDLIEGGYTKTHLSREMTKEFNLSKDLKILKNMGANGRDLFKWFHYIERDPKTNKVIWNPEALSMPGFERPAFKEWGMKEPTAEVKQILFKFREMTDWAWRHLSKNEDISYLRAYVGRIKKVKTGGTVKRNLEEYKAQKAGLLLPRKLGNIRPEEAHLYETDLYNLMPKIMSNSIRAASYSKSLDSLLTTDTMLRFMGMRNMADSFQKYAKRAMGANSKKETVEILATHALKTSADKIDAMINMLGKQGDAAFKEDVINASYQLMYNSYLGLSPGLLIKQFLQPFVVSSAEVGFKNIIWATFKAYTGLFAKLSREHINRVKERLYPVDFDYDMMGPVQRNWIKGLAKVLSWPGKPGFKLFTHMDKKNREIDFLAARHQLEIAMKKGGKKVAGAMEDLLEGEKNQIMNAFRTEGRESALDIYGLIRAKRGNYAYSMAERGEFFSEGMGAMVPFVHWGMNTWMRYLEDMRRGPKGIKSLAKRVGYAWATIATYQYLTNEQFYFTKLETPAGTIEVSSAHPISSMLGLAELSPFTALKAVQTGEVLPAVRAYKILTKKKKKKKKKIEPLDLFRFTPKKKKEK